jgi:type IV secretion system protein VirB1
MSLSTSTFLALALQCAPNVDPATFQALVKTESGLNPYAIGVVGKPLSRQPRTLDEALDAVKKLQADGRNFSIGLAQINKQHFNVSDAENVFEPCKNLEMGARILTQCYVSAQKTSDDDQEALRKAFSCYYSGNFTRGFKPEPSFGNTSYVDRVIAKANVKIPAITKDGEPVQTQKPSSPNMVATYESWDILRQYPRYESPPSQSQTTTGSDDDVSLSTEKGKNENV